MKEISKYEPYDILCFYIISLIGSIFYVIYTILAIPIRTYEYLMEVYNTNDHPPTNSKTETECKVSDLRNYIEETLFDIRLRSESMSDRIVSDNIAFTTKAFNINARINSMETKINLLYQEVKEQRFMPSNRPSVKNNYLPKDSQVPTTVHYHCSDHYTSTERIMEPNDPNYWKGKKCNENCEKTGKLKITGYSDYRW